MEKLTYVKALDVALDMFYQGGQVDPEDVEVVEKLKALKAQLEKRRGYKSNKPSKLQEENADFADSIAEVISWYGPVTCADVEHMFGVSNQKAAAILNRSGRFVKVSEAKGKVKALYGVAE